MKSVLAVDGRPVVMLASTGEEVIYKIHVTIRYKWGTFTFRNQSRMAEAIRANGGKQLNAFPIFEACSVEGESRTVSINKAHVALNNMLDGLQDWMMISDSKRHWYYPGSLDAKVQAFLAELEARRVELVDELEAHYDQARDLLEQRLKNVLAIANRIDDLDGYMRKFPTREEIRTCLQIEVEEPEPINKILDIASSDPIWTRSMERRRAALTRELPRALNNLITHVADLVRRMEGEDSRSLADRKKTSLLRAGECAEAAWLTYSGFCPADYRHEDVAGVIYSQVNAIYQAFTQWRWSEEQIAISLNNLRELLGQQDSVKSPVSTGEKQLAAWVFRDSIDGMLAQTWQEISNLKTLRETGALEEPEIEERERQLRIAISQLQERMGIEAKELEKLIAKRRHGGSELVARYMI